MKCKFAALTPRVIVIPCDEREDARVYHVKKEPSLWRLHCMVGGYIERVPHWYDMNGEPCNVWINEEGKLHGLPVNRRATGAWYNKLGQIVDDYLVGNVILVIGFPDEEYSE